MCKVLKYRFTCGHHFARCSSRCSGARSKITGGTRKAACNAEAYIAIPRSSPCPQCLKDSWLEAWKARLSAARTFYKDIPEEKPGVREIQRLVEELEEQFEIEAWGIKKEIPHVEKTRVGRVQMAKEGIKRGSMLRFEVMRENVVVREEGKQERGNDDDEGWEPIWQDPLYAINTDYDIWTKTAGVDEEYLLEFALGDETMNADIEYPGEDLLATNWEWGSGDETLEGGEHDWVTANSRDSDTEGEREGICIKEEDDQGVLPQLLSAHDFSPPSSLPPNNNTNQSSTHTNQIDALIETFKRFISTPVASGALPQPPSQSAPDILATSYRQGDNLHDERGSDGHCKPVESINLNSRQMKYIAFRKRLAPLKYTNPREYYEKWLEECRLEIREVVGPDGPRIFNPKK